jgi:branched-chain amino acid transport system permease protein
MKSLRTLRAFDAAASAVRLRWVGEHLSAHPWRRRAFVAIASLCGLALLYSLPVLTIPVINTSQVDFASVLFYPIGIYVLLSVGLDMTVGRTGQINLGYAAFFASGAYTTALLSTHSGMSYFETIVPAIVVSMVLGLIVGVVSLRVNGDYFAIVTLGIGLVVQQVVTNVGFFGTTIGIYSIPPPAPLAGLQFNTSSPASYDWLVFTMIIVVCVIFWLLYRGSLGRAWAAIREDDGAAELMGVKVRRLKVLASTIGAAPGGLAGSIYAAHVGYISPDTFGLTLSILVLAAVALGGKGRLVGVIVGAVLVGYLPERFLAVDKINTLLFGIVLVVVMLFRPQGIVGSLVRQRTGRSGRTGAGDAIAAVGGRGALAAANAAASALGTTVRQAAGAGATVSGPGSDHPSAGGLATTDISPLPASADDAWSGITPGELVSLRIVPVRASDIGAQPALTVEAARVAFGGVVALRDVSLSVAPGVVTSVIGPNGAGKTTLINAVTGVYRLDRGRVCLGGQDVTNAPIAQRSQKGIGRTFQNLRLFGAMTVLGNVLVAAEARGKARESAAADGESERPRAKSRDQAAKAFGFLEAVGLADMAAVRSDQLPYGAQRRLEIARALALDPKVLLLDEPAAGANTAEKRELMELIRKIADSGRAVLLVEHDMRLVMEVSTKVVVLNFGEVIADGSPAEVRRDAAVIAAYLGQEDHV